MFGATSHTSWAGWFQWLPSHSFKYSLQISFGNAWHLFTVYHFYFNFLAFLWFPTHSSCWLKSEFLKNKHLNNSFLFGLVSPFEGVSDTLFLHIVTSYKLWSPSRAIPQCSRLGEHISGVTRGSWRGWEKLPQNVI